jgi:hypothetical protein
MTFKANDLSPSLVRLGEEVQVDIHTKSGMLLLGKGHHVLTPAQRDKLLQMGVILSRVEEMQRPAAEKTRIPPPREFVLYELSYLMQRLGGLLKHALAFPDFPTNISDISDRLIGLAQRQPEGLISSIFQVPYKHYSAAHCVHTASLVALIALKEHQDQALIRTAVNAALTMNIAMMDLQDHLHDQSLPLTADQQDTIFSHPILGSALLGECGVEDDLWHLLVLQHHELLNGKGYPDGLSAKEIHPLAHLITLADISCAKLTGRGYRSSLLPTRALAQMFQSNNAEFDPRQTALLIKELSIYPPGSFVRLASDEIGVVVSRGKKSHEPRVAALRRGHGPVYAEPLLRETKLSAHKVIEPVSAKNANIRPSFLAKLWKL